MSHCNEDATLCYWRVEEKQVFGQVGRDERYLEGIIFERAEEKTFTHTLSSASAEITC